ncbi:hypothetical protein SS1G_05071 [Sclerotinia sclerotiorum 1980 UF-70]|uniref:Uncharacterized protein n=1 Tax=Sclerotinia sclerotiorum (strain ATCC 18683 / 1980 / Ss-1) TaxID=665079 RepID=A7EIC8_SCLS1|nr:hypothetical protein SS1G_05071 [Sclerotinia sclerotiorum 1980 UF-70]EDO02594.1 hypothetical protein SS1G_05071 [Sclerotinia sclerotiorum 1980 UF-70]
MAFFTLSYLLAEQIHHSNQEQSTSSQDIHQTRESDKEESLQQIPAEEPQVAALLSICILLRLLIKNKKEPRQTPYLASFVKPTLLVKEEVAKQNIQCGDETQTAPPLLSPFAVLKPPLKRTKIKNIHTDQHEYHFYGTTSSPEIITSEAANFICDNSRASKSSIKRILKQFLAITSQDSQDTCHVTPEAMWFIVNMTKKSKNFHTARWHRDGRMIECTDGNHILHCRYASTLSGPTTLVLPETDRVTGVMRTYAGNRRKISDILSSEEPLKISCNQIIRFSWGKEDSPVHSEPDLVTDRVFISCIYGSICEIKDIASTRRQVIGDSQAFFRGGGEKGV